MEEAGPVGNPMTELGRACSQLEGWWDWLENQALVACRWVLPEALTSLGRWNPSSGHWSRWGHSQARSPVGLLCPPFPPALLQWPIHTISTSPGFLTPFPLHLPTTHLPLLLAWTCFLSHEERHKFFKFVYQIYRPIFLLFLSVISLLHLLWKLKSFRCWYRHINLLFYRVLSAFKNILLYQ